MGVLDAARPAVRVRELAGRLDLELSADGAPVNPVVVLDLDEWRSAPAESIAAAAALVSAALPITVGILTSPPAPALAPLIEAMTLTLASVPAPLGSAITPLAPAPAPLASIPTPMSGNFGRRAILPASELPGEPTADEAIARLCAAVEYSPRAAIACGQLVRQTAVLGAAPDGTTAGLAAEAAAYSLLLGGPEFARWRAERGTPRHRSAPAQPVLIDRDGGTLSVTLNVPERRNAFSAILREALLDTLLLAEADETIESFELRGAGPAFCSGGDLDEFGAAKDLVAAYLVRLSRAPWRVIDRIAPKVAVYAHGACVGAGTEMLAYASRVVAAPDTFFQLPEVRMGLVPGAGGSVSVPRRIGRHRAAWLMLTGDRLPADTALRWGLVDEIR